MENTNNEVNEEYTNISRTYIDEFGLYNLDQFKKKHCIREDACETLIWLQRKLLHSQ